MADFDHSLKGHSYGKTKETWAQQGQGLRETAQVMTDLKEELKPDIIELIQKQRLASMEMGTRFYKYRKDGGKVKGKETYCKLDSSHKTLHFKDINENDPNPPYDELLKDDNSIPVNNIEGKYIVSIV